MSRLAKLILAGALATLLAAGAAAGWLVWFAVTPVAVEEGARELMIKKGRSLGWISAELVRTGVLGEPWSFRALARVLGRASAVQAGVYRLPERITPYRLLEMLVNGEVMEAQITFIETLAQHQC